MLYKVITGASLVKLSTVSRVQVLSDLLTSSLSCGSEIIKYESSVTSYCVCINVNFKIVEVLLFVIGLLLFKLLILINFLTKYVVVFLFTSDFLVVSDQYIS